MIPEWLNGFLWGVGATVFGAVIAFPVVSNLLKRCWE